PRPDEMLMALSGLDSTTSILDSEYPVRDVSESDLLAMRYEYADAKSIRKPVDHITCHPDGRFHIRTRDRDLYVHTMQRVEPLGPDTPIFLEFTILSDKVRNYTSLVPELKAPCVPMRVHPDAYVAIRGMFSGSNYDLESTLVRTVAQATANQNPPYIRLLGNT